MVWGIREGLPKEVRLMLTSAGLCWGWGGGTATENFKDKGTASERAWGKGKPHLQGSWKTGCVSCTRSLEYRDKKMTKSLRNVWKQGGGKGPLHYVLVGLEHYNACKRNLWIVKHCTILSKVLVPLLLFLNTLLAWTPSDQLKAYEPKLVPQSSNPEFCPITHCLKISLSASLN